MPSSGGDLSLPREEEGIANKVFIEPTAMSNKVAITGSIIPSRSALRSGYLRVAGAMHTWSSCNFTCLFARKRLREPAAAASSRICTLSKMVDISEREWGE